MSSTGGIAVIVLAAGKSSRMGRSKSLLQMGNVTAIERVLDSVTQAGVDDVVVVTGHDPDPIVAIIDRLPVRRVHNAEHESGMFSSVRSGVRALGPGTEALMIVPADYPLIGTKVSGCRVADGKRSYPAGLLPGAS
jgi:molybdenum cofactor cytidylyltransferase